MRRVSGRLGIGNENLGYEGELMALGKLGRCFGLGQGRVGKGRRRQCADLAREVGAVLELAQHHGKEEGAGHEHKGEEGCVGQGPGRFEPYRHIVLVMLLQRVALEDLQQKTKAPCSFPSNRPLSITQLPIHHPSTYLLPQPTW